MQYLALGFQTEELECFVKEPELYHSDSDKLLRQSPVTGKTTVAVIFKRWDGESG